MIEMIDHWQKCVVCNIQTHESEMMMVLNNINGNVTNKYRIYFHYSLDQFNHTDSLSV